MSLYHACRRVAQRQQPWSLRYNSSIARKIAATLPSAQETTTTTRPKKTSTIEPKHPSTAVNDMPSRLKPGDQVRSAEQRWKTATKSELAFLSNSGQTIKSTHAGRTVFLSDVSGNPKAAFTALDSILNENSVRRTWLTQMRHVKRGVGMRAKSAQHWRRIFASEIRNKIQLAKYMRNRGA